MFITDATGTSQGLQVDSENRAKVAAITSSLEHHINHAHGKSYTAVISQAPTANDDCILYLVNTSDIDLAIGGLSLSVSAACEIYIQLNDVGTRNSATGVIPVNNNAGSGLTAEATVEYGADLDGGAATLTGGSEVFRLVYRAATDSICTNFPQDLILPKNKTLTLWCDTAAVVVDCSIPINFHEEGLG